MTTLLLPPPPHLPFSLFYDMPFLLPIDCIWPLRDTNTPPVLWSAGAHVDCLRVDHAQVQQRLLGRSDPGNAGNVRFPRLQGWGSGDEGPTSRHFSVNLCLCLCLYLPVSPSPYLSLLALSHAPIPLYKPHPIHDLWNFRSQCTVELNGVKGAPSDVIIGSIERLGHDGLPVDGDPVCTLEGSWLGFLDFGGIRSEFGPFFPFFCVA